MSGTARRLVFGDDGSPGADVAWLWVCNHRWPGWQADVVTAGPPPFPPPAEPADEVPLEEWESPHPRLLAPQSELEFVRHLLGRGDPRIVLAARTEADLLVIGKVGQMRGVATGSTADWLLHHPPAPMVLVRSARPVKQVLVAADGSAHAQLAVEAFTGLPWSSGTSAVVVTVDDGRTDVDAAQRSAIRLLEGAGVTTRPVKVSGRPTAAILEQIEQLEPELAVLGTRGLTGLARLRLGSTAGHVVRTARASALVACKDE